MGLIRNINNKIRLLYDANYRWYYYATKGKYNDMDDVEYLKKYYECRMGRKLDVENPKGFNEKIQWLKLYDRNPLYTILVDKYLVKSYVADKIGKEYIIPTLGVWNNVNDIDFNKLPNQFVLKCNHNSGGLCICKDKSKLDINTTKQKLQKSLQIDYYLEGREWAYKYVPKKIIAEEFVKDDVNSDELTDYKFMCFDGKVRFCFTCTERFSHDGMKITFYDRDWNKMPFIRHYPCLKEAEEKPICYDLMLNLAEKLSKNIPFVRVDFYQVDGKVYFGEFTFYPASGVSAFTPEEWDYKIGDCLKLPLKTI